MLKPAFYYQEALNNRIQESCFNEQFKYYFNSSWVSYTKKLRDNSWEELEFVSVKNGRVIGFLGAEISRDTNSVTSLQAINFIGKNIGFAKDFRQFLIDLFVKFRFDKIDFAVVIGYPAEKMYDRFIEKYGGRIIGVYQENCRLLDGLLYDQKVYEIMRKDFLRKYKYGTI